MSFGNTRTLLDRIGVMVGHSPQDRDTREARLDILNSHLYDVCDQFSWRFLQTEADLLVWSERTYASSGRTITFTLGSHVATLSGALGANFTANAPGLTISDGTDTYVIGAISGTTIYLVGAYTGTGGVNTTWSIKTEKVCLPINCAQALAYIDRVNGKGRLISLDRRTEELYLSQDGNSATGDVWWMVDGDFTFDRPPDSSLTAAVSVGGSLVANSIYQYCYTFEYEGRETMPSVIVEGITSSSDRTITLTGIEDVQDGGNPTGKNKILYRRLVSSGSVTLGNVNGRWLRMATIGEATVTVVDNGAVTPSTSDSTALHYEGSRQFIRPRWMPDSDQTLRVRYVMKPKRLISDADVPMGPPNLWKLLLIRTAMEIVGSNSELAKSQDWERKGTDLMKKLKADFLQVPDQPSRKQMWSVMPRGGIPLRAGTVTSDFGS